MEQALRETERRGLRSIALVPLDNRHGDPGIGVFLDIPACQPSRRLEPVSLERIWLPMPNRDDRARPCSRDQVPKFLCSQAAKLGQVTDDETGAWSDGARAILGENLVALGSGLPGYTPRCPHGRDAGPLALAVTVAAAPAADRAGATAVFQFDGDLRFEPAAGPPAVAAEMPEAEALWGRVGTVERRVRELLAAGRRGPGGGLLPPRLRAGRSRGRARPEL
ncbi:MAG: hypothetical protein U5S82_19455 [Gammaproteobacteria bacterium]|nr:hypothetical protein [Gammaproteobacteria bacterium]